MTWRELVAVASEFLPAHESRLLVAETAGLPLRALLAHLDEDAPAQAKAALQCLVDRRVGGEPLQHVIGHWSFRFLELRVDRRALIPRPETEVLVDYALAEADALGASTRRLLVLDLGTGTGAIACSLVHERTNLAVVGIDDDRAALCLAEENRASLDPPERARVQLCAADFSIPLPLCGRVVDMIVANPPYVAETELEHLDPVVRDHEPRHALVAGPSGHECALGVLARAQELLAGRGVVLVEIAPSQGEFLAERARASGATEVEVAPDLAGRPRVLIARYRDGAHR